MSGEYNNADNWLAWGILRDDAITKVLINDQIASVFDVGDLRLCYIVGQGRMPESDNFLFYDNMDNLVWEISNSQIDRTDRPYPTEVSDKLGEYNP